jgi:hypothetical protein
MRPKGRPKGRKNGFKQCDVERLYKAAKEAGVELEAIEFSEGKLRAVTKRRESPAADDRGDKDLMDRL